MPKRGRVAPLGRHRLAGPATVVALTLAAVAAVGETAASVVAGRLAAGPTGTLVVVLAALLLGGALLDIAGRTLFSGVVGRAEQVLRADLLHAALHQPLATLDEQAVGEIIDRVDDDPVQLGTLLRHTGWETGRATLRSGLAWVVAGLTWWPAWIAFPVVAVAAILLARALTPVLAARKEAEEVAWSDHAAQLEEAVAGRDDVRSSLGQPHVLRQYALRSRDLLERVRRTGRAATTVTLRTGLVLQLLLVVLALAGTLLVGAGRLTVGELVTLWLLTSSFAGQLGQVTHRFPELQAGIGALARIRSTLGAPQERAAGGPVPPGPATVEFRGLTFAYPGGFALREVDLAVPAGTTCALVGRTGAGKSTLAKLLSRAIEPPPGSVLLGGQDVTATALHDLRRTVGVVTQRTEILTATLRENITLFADVPPPRVTGAVAALGLESWVAALPAGLDTPLGVGGTTLSAGEEQLVAFARLLVRDVSVVVLDEATARMDPQTERLVTRAAERLLRDRTGLLVAHRLSTTERCDTVAVLDAGRVVQHGPRARLAVEPGPFRDLLDAAGPTDGRDGGDGGDGTAATAARRPSADRVPAADTGTLTRGPVRRENDGDRTVDRPPGPRPSLARTVVAMWRAHPGWGLVGAAMFAATSFVGTYGAVTGWLWGRLVGALATGGPPWVWAAPLAVSLLAAPVTVALAFRVYPLWWDAVTLRLRLAMLRGQTMQRRLHRTAPGEVVARALESERILRYADRWLDVVAGLGVVAVLALVGDSALAGAVLGAVLGLSALVAVAGAPLAGAVGREAGDRRARLGTALSSALDAVRTVTLAGALGGVQAHLEEVDAHRSAASIREHRVRALLDGVPGVLCQVVVVVAWTAHLRGVWDLPTALLVTTTAAGFGWFGTVAAATVTETPVAARWLRAAAALAGRSDLTSLPPGVDLVAGRAPRPDVPGRVPLRRLTLDGVTAVHDDGTVGVRGVDLVVDRGALVLLAGRVGAGKSSLLAGLAGLVDHEGTVRWNDEEVADPQIFLRPGQVAYVGQLPRVLSGTFHDNVALDHARDVDPALDTARMTLDVARAGGSGALVGHRGVRLSGGQVQRLALSRALAADPELLVADDVSSALDARTEVELWDALRRRGLTVVGASSKRSALERADLVVVLEEGRVAATGPWAELADRWGHLAG